MKNNVVLILALMILIPSVNAILIQCHMDASGACIGYCRAGTCAYITDPVKGGGYCGCSTTTTTLQPPCSAIKVARDQKSCDIGLCDTGTCKFVPYAGAAGGYCRCETTTPPYCYYDTYYEKCVGICREGGCVLTAPYQCGCVGASTTTTVQRPKVTTTSTTIHKPTVGDLLRNMTFIIPTTTLRYIPPTTLAVVWAFKDDDGDGVMNMNDDCQGTPNGTAVNDDGCGCTENDGGIKAYKKGQTITFTKAGPIAAKASNLHMDTCVNASHVREHYCTTNQTTASQIIACPAGCQNGACVCNDGDGGLNYTVKGGYTTTIGGAQQQESLGSSGYVVNGVGQKIFLKNTPYSDILLDDRVHTGLQLVMDDYCVSDTVLKEFYCDGEGNIQSLDHVCKDACDDGRCVTIPNVNLLFVPVRWAGTQADFDAAVQEQVDFFVNAIPLKDCPDEVKITQLPLSQKLNATGFDCNAAPASVKNHVSSLGINTANYDVLVGLTDGKPCGDAVGWSNGADAIWVCTPYASVAAHELGHIYQMEDEYCSNLAGSVDGRCNDGGAKYGGVDVNGLDGDNPEYCPPDGSVPAAGGRCCNWNAVFNCTKKNYGICCLGNKNLGGGRSIMSFANAEDFSPGPREFDEHDKAYLATVSQLQCGNDFIMFIPLIMTLYSASTISDESGAAEGANDTGTVGYTENLTSGKVIDVDLSVGKDGSVSENQVIMRGGRPTMIPSGKGDYNLMVVDENGKTLWSQTFNLYYDYNGPVVDGVDYSGISVDTQQVSYRVPYFPQMKELRLYKKGAIIYSTALDFCNNNGVCDSSETADSCPADCIKGIPDKPCNSIPDGVCQQDCGPNTDPDCEKPEQPEQPKEFTCIPLLGGLLALALSAVGIRF